MRGNFVVCCVILVFVAVGAWIACDNEAPVAPRENFAPIEGIEGASLFEWAIGPIAGLTTVWHPTPDVFSVPVGTTIQLKCGGSDAFDAHWINATEVRRGSFGSIAEVRVRTPGRIEIQAEVIRAEGEPGGKRSRDPQETATVHTCVINGVDAAPHALDVQSFSAWAPQPTLDDLTSNFETMTAYQRGSIAELRPLGEGRYRTSVGRRVGFHAAISDPRFASMVESRATGQRPQLGSTFDRMFALPGTYVVSIGTGTDAKRITIETYAVTITSQRTDRDVEANNEKMVFAAKTNPPGLESEITWLSSTRSGRAEPVLGKGPTFSVTLTDVYEADPATGLRSRWVGVRADNATFSNDALCPTDTCAYWANWKKNKQANAPAAPINYVPLPGSGTAQGGIDWLVDYDNQSDPLNVGESLCGLSSCFGDCLWDSEKAAIVAACQNQVGDLAKALCAGQQVRALFQADPSYVCRHHAIALESVLECMNISAGLECAYKFSQLQGHAWVEITVGGNRYMLDSYNAIYICCIP